MRHDRVAARGEAAVAPADKTPRGPAPLPPALWALGTVFQAYAHGGAAEAGVTARLDTRGPWGCGTRGDDPAPFAHGALGAGRARLLPSERARPRGSRPGALAQASGPWGWQPLPAAGDAAPLLGAGRGEDTGQGRGRALPQRVGWARRVPGLAPAGIRHTAGGRWVGPARCQAARDGAGEAPQARPEGCQRRGEAAAALGRGAPPHRGAAPQEPPGRDAWDALARRMPPALAPAPGGGGCRLRRGPGQARRPAWGARERRQGRTRTAPPLTGAHRHGRPRLGAPRGVEAGAPPAHPPAQEGRET